MITNEQISRLIALNLEILENNHLATDCCGCGCCCGRCHIEEKESETKLRNLLTEMGMIKVDNQG